MTKKAILRFNKCANCGFDRALHKAANLSDGVFVGEYLTICPTALFKPTEEIVKEIIINEENE